MATKVDRAAVNQALLAVTNTLRGSRPNKAAEERKQRKERSETRLADALRALTEGDTRTGQKFNYRWALTRMVAAIKDGAAPEQLRACTALQQVAPWEQLREPLVALAEARGINTEMLLDCFVTFHQDVAAQQDVVSLQTVRRGGRRLVDSGSDK
jgi:hypothetical protein